MFSTFLLDSVIVEEGLTVKWSKCHKHKFTNIKVALPFYDLKRLWLDIYQDQVSNSKHTN